jgi:spore germination protein GerM
MFKRKSFLFILACMLIGTVLFGCTRGVRRNGEQKEEQIGQDVSETPLQEDAQRDQDPYQVYFIRTTDTSFHLESEVREFEQEVTPEILAQELLKGPKNSELSKTIPDDTEIISASVTSRVVTIDFTKEITMGRYGSEAEMLTLNSIFQTMTQLPDVDAVQILIEGEKVETLWGHADIREPIRMVN